jgi:hypothetical protein
VGKVAFPLSSVLPPGREAGVVHVGLVASHIVGWKVIQGTLMERTPGNPNPANARPHKSRLGCLMNQRKEREKGPPVSADQTFLWEN